MEKLSQSVEILKQRNVEYDLLPELKALHIKTDLPSDLRKYGFRICKGLNGTKFLVYLKGTYIGFIK
ncbi:hypothetical protein ISS37_01835 [candidate division KSB1 bacterium]|nr:hypothetical protein [candidate division KSB1 bacterium]